MKKPSKFEFHAWVLVIPVVLNESPYFECPECKLRVPYIKETDE
jgi:hypothetical protein